ncbi:MAG TPA: S53 family peptidase [Bryobacteraceae bacterium]|nr:S53 family peptidase [Bryobacteraceae bacterium]
MSSNRWATCALVAAATFFPLSLAAQNRRPPMIQEPVENTVLRTLAGNVRPEARPANDRGAVEDSLRMDHMLLQLQRSPEQEEAVRGFIEDLHDVSSPGFHHWLTAEQFGKSYGPAQEDVDKIKAWLESQGLRVNGIYPSGMTIDFSGTAGQVREAFHTSIHQYDVNGVRHIANASDPQIPRALAAIVHGVVALHDFRPHSMKRSRPNYTFTSGGYVEQAVAPADLATIYNLNPLFKAGLSGAGQTVAVIEDTNLYSAGDWTTFRSTLGLNVYSSGSLQTLHPAPQSGENNCADPGLNSDDFEATLDAEWASAAAPSATIVVASCGDTYTTFGGYIALENLVNSANPPSVISISYGECESEDGAAANAAFNTLYQQAVAEGISVFVSAGDEGAASCDANLRAATHGIGISGWASTPYNVAVGGTDFADTYLGTNSDYWSDKNSSSYGSALSYIPEIPWNNSCAGSLLVDYIGYPSGSGADGFCGSWIAEREGFLTVVAASGGPSGCATGSPYGYGLVNGTCKGYAKPSWQSGVPGIPSDNVRDIPDVSLFAANGLWGHYYVVCFSDPDNGGTPCLGAPSHWAGAGGTSFSAPILAGIQALVNQKQKSAQGNPNYVYYKLAARQYKSNAACPGSGCIFHDVTVGDITVNCAGPMNCNGAQSAPGRALGIPNGALSVTSKSFNPAYATTDGWDFATGIGSVDAYKLVMNWTAGQ